MKKVLCVGEFLIDMLPQTSGVSLKDVDVFIKKPGGAPINVAVAIHRLGGKASVMTQVGKDAFGKFLRETLEHEGLDCQYVYDTDKEKTSLAFVSLDARGERSFSFYRNPSADQLLDVSKETIDTLDADIIHFGSVGLAPYPMKETTNRLIEFAINNNKLLSFDVNVRDMLFPNKDEYIETIKTYIQRAHIIKCSKEELEWITHEKDIQLGVQQLFTNRHKLFIISDGPNGVYAYTKDHIFFEPSIQTKVVDTTGAGDALMGAFLFMLSQQSSPFDEMSWIQEALAFSVKVATRTIQKKGAMSSLPTNNDILINF